MESHMLREIREQPQILNRIGEQVEVFLDGRRQDLKAFGTPHLVGCGDMDFSARTAAWLAGAGVCAHRSMDLRWKAKNLHRGDWVIAASFSGRTPRTCEAALRAVKHGATVWGITGNAGSPLSDAVGETLVLDTGPTEELERHPYAGYHYNVPQTKTFTAVLLAELLLLRAAGCMPKEHGRHLDTLADDMKDHLPAVEKRLEYFMEASFRPVERIAVLGSGPWRPLAAYGAAKFLEMAVPARHQCLEENNHLEMFVTQRKDLLVFLAPDAASFSRTREMIEPYGRFGALRLILAPSSVTGCEKDFVPDDHGAVLVSLPEGNSITRVFTVVLALQVLAAHIGPALGRDINQWVGGVRTPLIESLGQVLVRESKVLD
jgi:glucosamine 6-phosphate synthetase-like amidotransferase/phosphosugar isomerase protein